MKKLLVSLLSLATLQLSAQTYEYKVDLNKTTNDQLSVELKVPTLKQKNLYFHLPAMVPGTYSVYNFGRFVSDFKAFDQEGAELSVEHPDVNTWKIINAKTAAKITYKVDDTWDTDKGNVIFEPAGTNIDKDVFVFNNHGIFGYFKKYEKLPYKIEVDRPEGFFGGTGMKRTGGDADTDIFETDSYNSLVDNPILFSAPDTAMFQIGETSILIQTYSPTGRVKSKDLTADIKPILEAQREYLGGKLPVDHYVFLLFLNKEGGMYLSGSAGALEHSYSSFYCLFEGEAAGISQTIRDVAAHEFFHIVTPLNIHSKEIHDFDFIKPEMSKHLWLYEGGTEYAAQHVQVKQQLIPVQQFFAAMGQKIRQAEGFKKDLSFTEMSKTCLDENKSEYSNVYLKGALINMCLDMELRKLSKGTYGTQNLMNDLSKKYGINKPFKDKCLFKEIGKITGYKKEMKAFFANYVAGIEALPIERLMKDFGVDYKEKGTISELSIFGFNINSGVTFNFEKKLIELKPNGIDPFGKDILGLKGGDLLYKWQGKELTMQTLDPILGQYQMSAKKGLDLSITVLRKNAAGKYEEKELKGALRKVPIEVEHVLLLNDKASPEQVSLRKAWLGDYLSE
ncbi:MAG: M61 family glycyl aminopeptidase [uncultured Aureispira sp.]|uniref:M61 family glycyl aminopeptidase n=1 Tax=uncultured Aureispira sp. TaxID=1331704 RepID=A0A6S6T8G1_9BACT|nr:MAG: M61 family glycyl aminopeptidase [uncultured Aureispira sp.]